MEPTKYIWQNGKLLPWQEANIHVLTHTLHYGAGAFEGIRAYKTDRGGAVFRLSEHLDRLYYSAKTVGMEIPYTKEDLTKATIQVLNENGLDAAYIRPIAFYGYGVMGLNPKGAPVEVSISSWAWGRYLPHDMVDIKISKFVRIHPQTSAADAKICGHYVNSIHAALEVRGSKYHEALLLDYKGNIAEGPGENIFLVKSGKLYTPKLGTILAGITRDTTIKIASDKGYEVIEKDLLPEDLFSADEAFFTGTAAEITPIRSVNDHVLGSGEIGEITSYIKNTYADIVYGRNKQYESFLTYIKS